MSMDQAPENNLPPHTDAAHRDPAAGTGLRLGGDWARERDALRAQVAACEADNTQLRAALARVTDQWQQAEAHLDDVNGDLARVRTWCAEQRQALRDRPTDYGLGPEFNRGAYAGAVAYLTALGNLLKPVV